MEHHFLFRFLRCQYHCRLHSTIWISITFPQPGLLPSEVHLARAMEPRSPDDGVSKYADWSPYLLRPRFPPASAEQVFRNSVKPFSLLSPVPTSNQNHGDTHHELAPECLSPSLSQQLPVQHVAPAGNPWKSYWENSFSSLHGLPSTLNSHNHAQARSRSVIIMPAQQHQQQSLPDLFAESMPTTRSTFCVSPRNVFSGSFA